MTEEFCKLGRFADWLGVLEGKSKNKSDKSHLNVVNAFSYMEEESENGSFQVVDKRVQKKPMGYRLNHPNQQQKKVKEIPKKGASKSANANLKKRWSGWKTSVQSNGLFPVPTAEWTVIEEYAFTSLTQLKLEPKQVEDVETVGELLEFDRSIEKINSRTEKPIEHSSKSVKRESISDDSVMQQLVTDSAGDIFASDIAIAALMTCTRSVLPWDVLITKRKGKLFLDVRSKSILNHETVLDSWTDSIDLGAENSPFLLIDEATKVNDWFLDEARIGGKQGDAIHTQFVYRRWNLGENCKLICRSRRDASTMYQDRPSICAIRCLNQVNPLISGLDFRSKVDTQRGAIVAAELLINGCRLVKWGCQAMLSGSEFLKLGYSTRVHSANPSRHSLLGVQSIKVEDFLHQLGFSVFNGWGIVKAFINIFGNLEDGSYVMVKESNKGSLKLYNMNVVIE